MTKPRCQHYFGDDANSTKLLITIVDLDIPLDAQMGLTQTDDFDSNGAYLPVGWGKGSPSQSQQRLVKALAASTAGKVVPGLLAPPSAIEGLLFLGVLQIVEAGWVPVEVRIGPPQKKNEEQP